MQEVIKEKKNRENEKNRSLKEEELVCAMPNVIQYLQSQSLSLSLTNIAKELHIDSTKLKSFPKI